VKTSTLVWIGAAAAAWYVFLRPRPAPPVELPVWTAGGPQAGTIVTIDGAQYRLTTPAGDGRWHASPHAAPGMLTPAVSVVYDPTTGAIAQADRFFMA